MIRIAISQAAFEAIARTLPLGTVSFENKTDEEGNRLIWLDRAVVDRLRGAARPRRELQRRDPAVRDSEAGGGRNHPLAVRRERRQAASQRGIG